MTQDYQLISITKKKPDKLHANNAGLVLYYCKRGEFTPDGQWRSESYDYIPLDAIDWTMLPDNPAPIETEDEASDRAMNDFLKQQYEDTQVRVAIYPMVKLVWTTARRFFDGRK